MAELISFDSRKVSRNIEQMLTGFMHDPADSDYQRGYLAALITVYEEGCCRGIGDDRIAALKRQVAA